GVVEQLWGGEANTSPAVVVVVRSPRVQAAAFHFLPRPILWRAVARILQRFTVAAVARREQLVVQAATTLCLTSPQFLPGGDDCRAAVAPTLPRKPPATRRRMTFDHDEPPEAATGEINPARHGGIVGKMMTPRQS